MAECKNMGASEDRRGEASGEKNEDGLLGGAGTGGRWQELRLCWPDRSRGGCVQTADSADGRPQIPSPPQHETPLLAPRQQNRGKGKSRPASESSSLKEDQRAVELHHQRMELVGFCEDLAFLGLRRTGWPGREGEAAIDRRAGTEPGVLLLSAPHPPIS